MVADKSQSRRQLRPSVEGLESLRLLSAPGHAVASSPVASAHSEATKATAPVAVVELRGTIHSTVEASRSGIAFIGSGNLGAVGKASIDIRLDEAGPLPTFTLSTRRGKITLTATESAAPGVSPTSTGPRGDVESFPYTVFGGTGAYAHATGSGTITAAAAISKAENISENFTFS